MKTWIKTSIAAALFATTAVGATAFARGGDCDGPRGERMGMHRMAPEQMKVRLAERTDLQLARLELALALMPAQQGDWATFKTAMKARADKMVATMEARSKEATPKTAVDRMQRMEEMSKLRQTEMADTRKAVEAFYGKLSAAQKTVFDAEFAKLAGGHGPMHGKGEGRGYGPGRG